MKYRITLNKKTYEVEVEETNAVLVGEYDAIQSTPQTTEKETTAPIQSSPTKTNTEKEGENAIKAPLPGNVVKICVTEGEEVKKGQTLLIIEAMKMENEIPSDRDGKVSRILVSKGQTVERKTPLVEIV